MKKSFEPTPVDGLALNDNTSHQPVNDNIFHDQESLTEAEKMRMVFEILDQKKAEERAKELEQVRANRIQFEKESRLGGHQHVYEARVLQKTGGSVWFKDATEKWVQGKIEGITKSFGDQNSPRKEERKSHFVTHLSYQDTDGNIHETTLPLEIVMGQRHGKEADDRLKKFKHDFTTKHRPSLHHK